MAVPEQGKARKTLRQHAQQADQSLGAFRGRLPLVRAARGSTSVEIHTEWLRVGLGRLGRSSHLTYATVAASPDPFLPSVSTMPSLPSDWQVMLNHFIIGNNTLFPLLDAEALCSDAEEVLSLSPGNFCARRGGLTLMQIYLAVAVGAEGKSISAQPLITYAKSMLGHVSGLQSPSAVKAVALLSVALKQTDEVMSAWHVLGMAVRAALSIEIDARTWNTLYTLDKLMAFELGRPSNIDERHDERLGEVCHDHPSGVITNLARLLSDVGRRCLAVSQLEEKESDVDTVADVILNKVRTTGESCQSLLRWADRVPFGLRPTNDLLSDSGQEWPCRYISAHYYSALLLLTRNSLLINAEAREIAVELVASDAAWKGIIRNGATIAANAARRMLRLELEDVGAHLSAILVLALFIATQPSSRLAASDIKLIESASQALVASNPIDSQLACTLAAVNSLVDPDHAMSPAPAAQPYSDPLLASNWSELGWDWDMSIFDPLFTQESQ